MAGDRSARPAGAVTGDILRAALPGVGDYTARVGDPTGDGTGGQSAWGEPFADEIDRDSPLYRDGYRRGILDARRHVDAVRLHCFNRIAHVRRRQAASQARNAGRIVPSGSSSPPSRLSAINSAISSGESGRAGRASSDSRLSATDR